MNKYLCVFCGETYESPFVRGACNTCQVRLTDEVHDTWASRMIRTLAIRITALESTIATLETVKRVV